MQHANALNRLNPLLPTERHGSVSGGVLAGFLVIVAWALVAFFVGGWRTATRDA